MVVIHNVCPHSQWKSLIMLPTHKSTFMSITLKKLTLVGVPKKFIWVGIIFSCDYHHHCDHQSSIKCGTARPSVLDSDGPSSIIKGPNIRSFVAKSVLSRFTRFLGVRTQPLTVKVQTKHCQIGQYMINIDWTKLIGQIFYR